MALFRLMLAICACAAGITAQDIFDIQKYGLYNLIFYSHLLKCHFNKSTEYDMSQMKIRLYDDKNNITKTYAANDSLADDPTLELDRLFVFYVKGYNSNNNDSNPDSFRENLKCLNITYYYIIVDHGYYTTAIGIQDFLPNYDKALARHYCIGKFLAKVLAGLYYLGVLLKNILLFGHSMGAHIAGAAGRAFKELTGVKLWRILGCDPAGPCFDNKLSRADNLNSNDADEVHIWHCDAGKLGTKHNYGTASYNSNGGKEQIGCFTPIIPELLLSAIASSCNHVACLRLCTIPICFPNLWPAKLCNSKKNFDSGACDGNGTCLASPITTDNCSGIYYFTTKGHSVV